jgi:CspA family cold shock protein
MATGTMKWFNNSKGWGFVSLEDESEAFVHYSDIEGDGFKALYVGDVIEFELAEGEKGAKAIHVVKTADGEGAPSRPAEDAPVEEESAEELSDEEPLDEEPLDEEPVKLEA